MAQTHTANCFCGEVELEVTGEPQQQSIHSIFLSEVSFECIGPQLFGVTFARSRTSGNPIGDRLFNFGGQRLTAFFF
jgi:hypothetical protein